MVFTMDIGLAWQTNFEQKNNTCTLDCTPNIKAFFDGASTASMHLNIRSVTSETSETISTGALLQLDTVLR